MVGCKETDDVMNEKTDDANARARACFRRAQLGVCVTVLKSRCRELGIFRWPYRKVKKLDSMIDCLEKCLSVDSNAESAAERAQKTKLMSLKEVRGMMLREPNSKAHVAFGKLRRNKKRLATIRGIDLSTLNFRDMQEDSEVSESVSEIEKGNVNASAGSKSSSAKAETKTETTDVVASDEPERSERVGASIGYLDSLVEAARTMTELTAKTCVDAD